MGCVKINDTAHSFTTMRSRFFSDSVVFVYWVTKAMERWEEKSKGKVCGIGKLS